MGTDRYTATLKIATFRHDDANLCYFLTVNNAGGTASSPVIMSPRNQMLGKFEIFTYFLNQNLY